MKFGKSIVILLSGLLSACQCKNFDVVQIEFMDSQDKLLNCRQLEYALLDTEAKLTLAIKQGTRLDAYTQSPLCLLHTDFAIEKAKQNAEARLHYLNELYVRKRCAPSVEKLSQEAEVLDNSEEMHIHVEESNEHFDLDALQAQLESTMKKENSSTEIELPPSDKKLVKIPL